jgi:spoIIIJ-associated protein
MSAGKQEIEMSGADVEEAISLGLARLGVPREKVAIEVVDEGSRGLLGLGRRPAVVRMRVIAPQPDAGRQKKSPPPAPPKQATPRPVVQKAQPEPPKPTTEKPKHRREAPPISEARPAAAKREAAELPESLREEADVAKEIWNTMLGKLGVDADVIVRSSEPDERTGRSIAIVDVSGRDLSLLIGPRGDTLNAMQYITRLMVAHQLKRRAYFVVDVEGYRERRTQALARLAERMAQKALKRGRPVTLEPMPPNERRAVHMALREVDGVYTQSTGEGDGRRVRILLEK